MNDKLKALRTLIDEQDLSFGDCIGEFAKDRTPFALAAVQVAKASGVEGELEVDDNAQASCWEDSAGCYVMAWLWVDAAEIEAAAAKVAA